MMLMALPGLNVTVQIVLIVYFQRMPLSNPSSKHSFKRKQQLLEKRKIGPRIYRLRSDKDTRILKSRCDLCNDELPKEADNIQYRINVLDEIDYSYESEYDKHEPRLLLCSFCTKEYNIPSYFIALS